MRIGTAGWSIPGFLKEDFTEGNGHLERYAHVFNAVEINSTFYKDHQPKTFAKWASLTPDDFLFSVKLHQRFSHDKEFKPSAKDLKTFLSGVKHLEEKFGVLLIQFPGKLEFSPKIEKLLGHIRKQFDLPIVIEPRNNTWINPEAIELYKEFKITKVSADPERVPTKKKIEFGNCEYYRLHGSPVIYRSSYSDEYLGELSSKLKKKSWVIFDNTMLGQGTQNALQLLTSIDI